MSNNIASVILHVLTFIVIWSGIAYFCNTWPCILEINMGLAQQNQTYTNTQKLRHYIIENQVIFFLINYTYINHFRFR